jgi:Protein of unknown function (DUF3053)
MTVINCRAAGIAALFLLAVGLAACGDSEPDQRKAFIGFLQTRIIDKFGVHIARPTGEEKKSFGPYAAHYAVILDFFEDIDLVAKSEKINDALPKLHSAQDLIDRRAEVRLAADRMGEGLKEIDVKLAAIQKARDALKQPDDLKAVYDAAFDKIITKPVQGFHETTPLAQQIAVAAANFGDYMAAHRDTVKIVGTSPQATDRKTQIEVNALANALNSLGPRMNDAQRRMRIMLYGS